MNVRLASVLCAGILLGILPGNAWATTPTPSPTPAVIEIQPVAAPIASTNDGNLPANAVDNNLNTRWSGYGDGAWIRFDFGSRRGITVIKVAAYRGHERRNRFDLQVSDDGNIWTTVAPNLMTSGTTTQEEAFDIPDATTRYVRYVGHGSTASLWNSVTEVSFLANTVVPRCTVSYTTTGNGVGSQVRVTANSNLGVVQYNLTIDQSSTEPVLSPADPPPMYVGSGPVSWDLTAERPGTARFAVRAHGEVYDPACGCYNFRNAYCSAGPLTIEGNTPTPTPTATVTPTPTTPPLVETRPVATTASTHDGNVPANTIDGSLATRWAGYGDGAWIQYDLGERRTIGVVKIAVYRGNERRNRFDLLVSPDGATWTEVAAGVQSSGATTAEETYDIPDQNTRYLRYRGHGSTVGLWNSLTEVSLMIWPPPPAGMVVGGP